MPPYISTSRTRAVYERPLDGPWVLNAASWQAQNLAAWWPLGDTSQVMKFDYGPLTAKYNLTVTGTNGRRVPHVGAVRGSMGGAGWSNTGSTSNYLTNNTTPITAAPLTMAAWFNVADVTAFYNLGVITDTGGSNYFTLCAAGDFAGDPVQAIASEFGEAVASSSTGYTANTSNLATGVFLNVNSRSAYLNGLSKGTNTTNKTPGSLANISAAAFKGSGSSVFSPLSGIMWHLCFWNVAFSDNQVFELYDPNWRWDLYYRLGRRSYSFVATGIAFDASSNSGSIAVNVGSTITWSHTCTGTDRFIAVDVGVLSAGQAVTGITYNGVALSLIQAKATVTALGDVESWGLVNPASGSNSIVVTLSGSGLLSAGEAVSYTGVHQTSPTEGAAGAQATNVGAADALVSVTSVADQCWIHAAAIANDASIAANQTNRNNLTDSVSNSVADEDFGPQSPGAKSMGYTGVGAGVTWAIVGYAIRPVGASNLGGTSNNLLLLGVG